MRSNALDISLSFFASFNTLPSPGTVEGNGMPNIFPAMLAISSNFEKTYSRGASLTMSGPGSSKSIPVCAGSSRLGILDGSSKGPSSHTYSVTYFFHPTFRSALCFSPPHQDRKPSVSFKSVGTHKKSMGRSLCCKLIMSCCTALPMVWIAMSM